MKKTKRPNKHKRKVGRPRTTGIGTLIGVRCHKDFLERVDKWQGTKAPDLSRPQAIRQLAERGLDQFAGANFRPFEIFRVPVPKAQLRAIPVSERNLLLLASHAVNQISTFSKLLFFSVHYISDMDIERTLSAAQSQTILRVLFGALAEAWEMVRRPENQKLIGERYANAIEVEGAAAYDKLKRHFGQSNLLHKLRNTIAYHHPNGDELQAAFEDVPDDEDWAWYPSETRNNSFYFASDLVISASILRVTGEKDTAAAFGKIMSEVVNVSNIMIDFFLYLMRAIVGRYMGTEVFSPRRGTGTMVTHAPDLSSVSIPFFTLGDRA
jgi:hypothetical protein